MVMSDTGRIATVPFMGQFGSLAQIAGSAQEPNVANPIRAAFAQWYPMILMVASAEVYAAMKAKPPLLGVERFNFLASMRPFSSHLSGTPPVRVCSHFFWAILSPSPRFFTIILRVIFAAFAQIIYVSVPIGMIVFYSAAAKFLLMPLHVPPSSFSGFFRICLLIAFTALSLPLQIFGVPLATALILLITGHFTVFKQLFAVSFAILLLLLAYCFAVTLAILLFFLLNFIEILFPVALRNFTAMLRVFLLPFAPSGVVTKLTPAMKTASLAFSVMKELGSKWVLFTTLGALLPARFVKQWQLCIHGRWGRIIHDSKFPLLSIPPVFIARGGFTLPSFYHNLAVNSTNWSVIYG